MCVALAHAPLGERDDGLAAQHRARVEQELAGLGPAAVGGARPVVRAPAPDEEVELARVARRAGQRGARGVEGDESRAQALEARVGAQRVQVGVGVEQLDLAEAGVDGALQPVEGAVDLAAQGARAGGVVRRDGLERRGQDRGLLVAHERLGVALHLVQRVPEPEPRLGVLGLGLDDLAIAFRGLGPAVHAKVLVELRRLRRRLRGHMGSARTGREQQGEGDEDRVQGAECDTHGEERH